MTPPPARCACSTTATSALPLAVPPVAASRASNRLRVAGETCVLEGGRLRHPLGRKDSSAARAVLVLDVFGPEQPCDAALEAARRARPFDSVEQRVKHGGPARCSASAFQAILQGDTSCDTYP